MTSKFICDLPWTHFSTMPHGVCTICCEANHSNQISHAKDSAGKLKSIHNSTVEEIVNSDSFKKIRKEMLEGKVPIACDGCYRTERAGGISKRIRDSKWNNDWASNTDADGSIVPDIRSIELRLGNYCNLKCRSCNAESSTSWIKEYYALKDSTPLASDYAHLKDNEGVIYSWDWTDDDDFYKDLLDNVGQLDNVHISGGEPFLVPKHFDFLKRLIDTNNTDVHIGYHTNLNYNLEKISAQLEMLSSFKQVRINLSIDDVEERNTYIRNPSDWNLTIHNLKTMIESYKHLDLVVCQTVGVYNFMYVEELYEYFKNNNIDVPMYINNVHSPVYQTPFVLPIESRQDKLEQIKDKMPEHMLKMLSHYGFGSATEKDIDNFITYTSKMDSSRGESFEKTFPVLYDIMRKNNE